MGVDTANQVVIETSLAMESPVHPLLLKIMLASLCCMCAAELAHVTPEDDLLGVVSKASLRPPDEHAAVNNIDALQTTIFEQSSLQHFAHGGRRCRRNCKCCCCSLHCCTKFNPNKMRKFRNCCKKKIKAGEVVCEEVVLFQHENATSTQLPNDLSQLLNVQNDQTSDPKSLLQGSTSETGGD